MAAGAFPGLRSLRQRLPDLPLMRWPAPAFLNFTVPPGRTFIRLDTPLCVFILGITINFSKFYTSLPDLRARANLLGS